MPIGANYAVDTATHRVLNFFAEEDSPSLAGGNKHNLPEGGYIENSQSESENKKHRRAFVLYKSQSSVELRLTGKGAYKDFVKRDAFSKLIAHGLSVVNNSVYKLNREISDEDLWVAIYNHLSEAYEGGGIGFPADIDREVSRAVAKVRLYWRPEVYPEIQERARAAGLKGKKYDDLGKLLETREMNVSEAARHLGISRPTVRKMRKEFEGIELQTGEINDE